MLLPLPPRKALLTVLVAVLCLCLTPVPSHASECDNLGEPVVLRAGLADDFAPPTDATSRRPELDTAFGSPTFWGSFDQTTTDHWVGHTFTDIPADLCRAELVIRTRPLNSSLASNDGVNLGSATSGQGFASKSFVQLPESGGTWDIANNGPTTFTLDLSTLGFGDGMTVLDVLKSERVLDVRVQDDSTVDYFELRLWSVPWTTRYCGRPDEFALPTDFTYRGPELEAALPSVLWKTADEIRTDRAVACTFQNLPESIFEAELEVRLQPGSSSLLSNDTLHLGLRGGSPLFAFMSEIRALPEAGGIWRIDGPPTTFNFDVSDLILDGRLDLYIQDDTILDYARLRYRTCPPPVPCYGWTCIPIGDIDFSNEYIALPTGSSIVFELNGANGVCANTEITCPDIGEEIVTTANFGGTDTPAVLTYTGGNPATVTIDFPGTEPFVRVEIWNGDTKVTEYFNAAEGLVATLPAGSCFSEIDLREFGSHPQTYCFEVYLTQTTEVDIAQGGPRNVTGDRVVICPPLVVPVKELSLSSIEVTNNGLDELVIGPSTVIVGEELYGAVGPVRLEPANGSLRVSEIPAEGGGFNLVTNSRQGEAQTFLLDLTVGAPGNTDLPPEGSSLQLTAFGTYDGVADQPLGRLELARPDIDAIIEVATDFSTIASPTQTVQVFQDGFLVTETVLPAGPAALLTGLPDRLGKLDTATEGYVMDFDQDITISLFEAVPDDPDGLRTPAKLTVVGDEIRLLAAEGTSERISGKSSLEVVAKGGIEELTVTNAHVGRACTPSEQVLCLNEGRFAVETDWRTPNDRTGTGHAVQLTDDTGYFWFFQNSNVEMVVKALDACASRDRFWVFAGGLTNVEVVMTVTDTWTGEVQLYQNPLEAPFQPLQDTSAFSTCDALDVSSDLVDPGPPPPGSDSILLNADRFEVSVDWTRANGTSGIGQGVQLTDDTGYFWFFRDTNVELVIKVLDACAGRDRFWVFAGGLTNVEARITVTDTQSGEVVRYLNPQATAFQPIQDTQAFATCP